MILVYVESVYAASPGNPKTPVEHMRVAERIAAERGHLAESIVRRTAGRVVTPQGFGDDAFDLSLATRRAVAARAVEESRGGLPGWCGLRRSPPGIPAAMPVSRALAGASGTILHALTSDVYK